MKKTFSRPSPIRQEGLFYHYCHPGNDTKYPSGYFAPAWQSVSRLIQMLTEYKVLKEEKLA